MEMAGNIRGRNKGATMSVGGGMVDIQYAQTTVLFINNQISVLFDAERRKRPKQFPGKTKKNTKDWEKKILQPIKIIHPPIREGE